MTPSMLLRRIAAYAATLLVVSLLIFSTSQLLRGDSAQIMLGDNSDPQALAQLRERMGLNRPAIVRYGSWLWGMAQGDWGASYITRQPVAGFLGVRARNTAILIGLAVLVAVPIAVLLGVLMVRFHDTGFDRGITAVLLALSATPEFMLAAVGVLLFSVRLKWLPSVVHLDTAMGLGRVAGSLVMPVTILSIPITAQIARMTRVTLLQQMGSSFVEMAKLKGAGLSRRILVHAMSNTVGALVNVVTINVAYLVGGIIVVETMFAVPGLSQLMIHAVEQRDMPVIEACAMIFCAVYIVLLALTDLLGMAFNPRLRKAA